MFDRRGYDKRRRHSDPEYRESRNFHTKRYQGTDRGRCALVAGYMNTRAKMVGVKGRLSLEDIWGVKEGGRCAVVGCGDGGPYEVDHIRALVLGGENVVGNLCLLCIKHHKLKSARERTMKAMGGEHLDWVLELQGMQGDQIGFGF